MILRVSPTCMTAPYFYTDQVMTDCHEFVDESWDFKQLQLFLYIVFASIRPSRMAHSTFPTSALTSLAERGGAWPPS